MKKQSAQQFVTMPYLAAAIGHTRAIVTRALRRLHERVDPRVGRIGADGGYVVSVDDAPSIIAELQRAHPGAPLGNRNAARDYKKSTLNNSVND